jgi:two-component sensor histidine kinase
MKIDWMVKLRHLLQTLAFCLAIAAIHYAFQPNGPYEVPLVYSLCIGCSTWALMDFGRHLVAPATPSGWPTGMAMMLLAVSSIVGGYILGTIFADSWLGFSSWSGPGLAKLPTTILITALAGISASYFFYSRGRGKSLQAQVSEASRQASEAKLKLLETQLEPHMLFNTLANLRVLIATDPQRAQDMLDRIVAYLRATLNASRSSSHALEREFERLRDYLELMAVRMGPRLHYVLELPPELAQQSVPTLLLQPLVENCIKHGLEPKVEGGTVTVRATVEGNMLRLEVSDTGVGFDPDFASTSGFGLAQVRERMATAYADKGRVEQTATPGQGSSTLLHLPLTADHTTTANA